LHTSCYQDDFAFQTPNVRRGVEILAHTDACYCVFQFWDYEAVAEQDRSRGEFEDLAEDVEDGVPDGLRSH
jgi:hypothetical protein